MPSAWKVFSEVPQAKLVSGNSGAICCSEVPYCEPCGCYCEPLEIEVCPICKKNFCMYCVYRVGSRNYCSRPCGDSYFLGGDDDMENMPDE